MINKYTGTVPLWAHKRKRPSLPHLEVHHLWPLDTTPITPAVQNQLRLPALLLLLYYHDHGQASLSRPPSTPPYLDGVGVGIGVTPSPLEVLAAHQAAVDIEVGERDAAHLHEGKGERCEMVRRRRRKRRQGSPHLLEVEVEVGPVDCIEVGAFLSASRGGGLGCYHGKEAPRRPGEGRSAGGGGKSVKSSDHRFSWLPLQGGYNPMA